MADFKTRWTAGHSLVNRSSAMRPGVRRQSNEKICVRRLFKSPVQNGASAFFAMAFYAMIVAMPATAQSLRGLIGKLNAVRVTCERCGRAGNYQLPNLIEEHGREAKVIDWLDSSPNIVR